MRQKPKSTFVKTFHETKGVEQTYSCSPQKKKKKSLALF